MSDSSSKNAVLALIIGGLLFVLLSQEYALQSSAIILRDSLLVIWLVSLFNILFLRNGLARLFGIRPRQLIGLLGIPCSPLLHRDIGHLVANTVPFAVLGWLILLQEQLQGNGNFYAVTFTVLLISGLGTWLFGRDAVHIGASGLVFGYIGFLLVSVYAAGPTILTIGAAVLVLWIYGAQLWNVFPGADVKTMSWEGHLFGFMGGVVAGLEPEFLANLQQTIERITQ